MRLTLSFRISFTRLITKDGILEFLEDILDFRRDPDVAIPTVEQACTNFNVIQRPLINTKCWGVQVK